MTVISPEDRRATEAVRRGAPNESQRRIIYQHGDGIAILIPAVGVSLDEVMFHIPQGSDPVVIDVADIPSDRTFRAAWKRGFGDQKQRVDVDMPKARNVWRDVIRMRRKPLLEALDIEYQKADENGSASEKAKIAAKRKKLRDATDDPRIESAQTPEDLKLIDPLA